MNFLKNQGIVLVLAALAIVLVGKNLVWPWLGPKLSRGPSTKVVAATPPAATSKPAVPPSNPVQSAVASITQRFQQAIATTVAAVVAPTTTPMNVEELERNTPGWAASPRRDPFKMRGGVNDKSAREQLTLTGILRQTESDLAVLNNRVLGLGDTILGFRVETVESDRVWVSGPNGREVLEFKYYVQAPRTPADSATAVSDTPRAGQ